jgi:hypothetical protein
VVTPEGHGGAVFEGNADPLLIGLKLAFAGDGADRGALGQSWANFGTGQLRRHFLYKLVMDRIHNDQSRGCGALLSGPGIGPGKGRLHRQIQIGIVEYDQGILRTHFQLAFHQVGGCG